MKARLKAFANGLDVGCKRENSRLTLGILTCVVNLMEFPFLELEGQLWEMKGKREPGFGHAKMEGLIRKHSKDP